MAIDFISIDIVSAGRGERAFGLGAYLCRERWQDPLTRRVFDFSKHAGDLLHAEVLLPEGAMPELSSPEAFVTAIEAAELVVVRKTRERRFRQNGQLVKHVILALPKGLNARQRLALAREWARTQYVDQGAGVLLVVHEADDPEIGNYHAHLLVTTREVGPAGLSRHKARHLNPGFSRGAGHERATLHKDDLPGQWRAFQNDFFRRHDIPLSVDPSFIVAGQHRGKGGFVPGSDVSATDDAAQQEARRRIREIPHLLEFVTRQAATFTRQSLRAALQKHEVPQDEIAVLVEKTLADSEVVRLIDPATGGSSRLFTTLTVRAQEGRILDLARTIAARQTPADRRQALTSAAAARATTLGLSDEQEAALLHCVTGANISCVRGVAGAGKSYTVKGIRETLEACGYRVVGLAPTNKVACSMAVDGFSYSATLHLESLRQKSARYANQRWDENTCIIVDEAGMVDSAMIEELLERAESTGAKVILVGDQAQLASVARGGMFGVLKDQLGCAEIREIRRQTEDWARAASLDFAEGNIAAGLHAYAERGHLRWSETLGDATDALVRQWQADFQTAPETERFVYTATNASVDRLNDALQAARWQGGAPAFVSFETKRGRISLAVGDRIQIYANLPKDGIYNGMIGTVTEATPDRVTFLADGGKELSFTPEDFGDFGLGYAGTVYRGQGQTLPQTYALYDSKYSWNRRTTYVALTRHKQAVSLYVPRTLAADTKVLARQMARDDGSDPSICFGAAEAPSQPTVAPDSSSLRAASVAASLAGANPPLAPPSETVVSKAGASTPPPAQPEGPAADLSPPEVPEPPIPPTIVPAAALAASKGTPGSTPRKAITLAAIPWRAPLSQPRDFDLSSEAERDALLAALSLEPMDIVCRVYAGLKALRPSQKEARDQLTNLRGQITSRSRLRGFLPRDAKVDRDCLEGIRLDPWNFMPDAALFPAPGEIDIRPMVQPLIEVSEAVRTSLAHRLKGFVIEALRNIDHSLGEASRRAFANEDLRLALVNTRAWFYGLCFGWGRDLHPGETARNAGQMLTPEAFRRDILVLGMKALAADPSERSLPAAPVVLKKQRKLYPIHHYDYTKEQLLRSLYEARLLAKVETAQRRSDHAGDSYNRYMFQPNGSFLKGEWLAAREHAEREVARLASYRRNPRAHFAVARPIDFLPIDALPEETQRRCESQDGFGDGVPDPAARWLWRCMIAKLYYHPSLQPKEVVNADDDKSTTPLPPAPSREGASTGQPARERRQSDQDRIA